MKEELLPRTFWYEDIYAACERIGERYHLSLNQVGQMDAAVRDLLGGYVGHGYFVLHLFNRINTKSVEHAQPITEATAERIVADIKREPARPMVQRHWINFVCIKHIVFRNAYENISPVFQQRFWGWS